MSDFSLTLVLQIKTSKIINDIAKIQQKSEKITAFGGIFFVLDKFDSILSSVIDSHLGLRSTLIGYLENRDGNCNVRFKQAETHRRFFEMMIHLLHRFRQGLAIYIPYTYHTHTIHIPYP